MPGLKPGRPLRVGPRQRGNRFSAVVDAKVVARSIVKSVEHAVQIHYRLLFSPPQRERELGDRIPDSESNEVGIECYFLTNVDSISTWSSRSRATV